MLQDLTVALQQQPSVAHVLWELSGCIASACNADGHRLYLPDGPDGSRLRPYFGQINDGDCESLDKTEQAPNLVGKMKQPMRMSRGDANFPHKTSGEVCHVLLEPVTQPDGELIAVLELWRGAGGGQFYEEDEEIANSYLVWGGIALHYARLYVSIEKQRKLSDFLLAVVKSIFQDMVSMDSLVTKIMNFAQRLVDADRASLFLLDGKNRELYARIFDVRGHESECDDSDTSGANSTTTATTKQQAAVNEIRFSVAKGIAGQVARTGEVLNIVDAYSDPRFNRTVDQLTGYKTTNILCMPIFNRGTVIGVVQMVNKHSGAFNKEDEEAFQTFAVYCGLALHHAKLYDKIRRSEQKYRVAMEILGYHNTCNESEFKKFKDKQLPDHIPGIDEYHFSVFKSDDDDKALNAIYMFKDLFGLSRFNEDSLIRFTLTVRKNYRRVPYHNWTHGFSVANSMYAIIKHTKGLFNANEVSRSIRNVDWFGMLIALVCVEEQQGHNIFGGLSSAEYKQVLGCLKHCILATDLARFFSFKARLQRLVDDGHFSWVNSEHRSLIQAIAMTASDLSASAKPWTDQVKTAQVIFQEFYEQGDAEREAGITPMPMMDRTKPELQASSQVGFLTSICIPCYSLLHKLVPETKPLLDQCSANLEQWEQIETQKKGGVVT
ncbi:probable 3',5'-cyclic phosphodiesterase pde-5 [Nilaparvata lugens]|uniref:probable 3',5'-cyclic phosphodiesterase pde-5 n=1 Tax=Nilaparvata lugens TaxID=108931 RepID=UPI00193C975E|nr:probable 3',5'-cyclic phosphodiesterase pde-5 [Nilaparvata lugens]